jgi:hypothetical protein
MSNVISRLSLRKAVESAEATKSTPTTKAPKAPKSPKTTKAAKKTETTEQTPTTETPEAPKAKKGRGMKGKTHNLPCYAMWTKIFECQGLAAEGKANDLGLKTPMTDEEISKFMIAEYDGKCKEHDKAAMLRGLFNRGKINKMTAVPTRLVGRFEKTPEGKLVEVVTARRVSVVG